MSEAVDVTRCQWLEPGGLAAAQAIVAFLEDVGIPLEVSAIDGGSFVPGLAIVNGTLRIDPMVMAWPGDLLHEAGHVAVVEPQRRLNLCDVGTDAGEEMAALAWSVAAAKACGTGLDVLFHPGGYKGDSAWLAEQFGTGAPFGVPLLAWYGMTSEAGFPSMERWLR